MTPEELLSQLKEIHEPTAIGTWPLAPGWWVLIITTLLFVLFTTYLWRTYRIKNAWKKEATKALTQIEKQANELSHHQSLHSINQLIKRIAAHKHNDASLNTLTGDAWQKFMDALLNGPDTPNMLSQKQLELLAEGQYKQGIDGDNSIKTEIILLLKALKNWIKEA